MTLWRALVGADPATDILAILAAQHAEIDALFARLAARDGDPRPTFRALATQLAAHTAAEAQVFYPAIVSKASDELLQEAAEDHLAIERVLGELIAMPADDRAFFVRLAALEAQVQHHMHDEEERTVLPQVRSWMGADRRAALGRAFVVAFEARRQLPPNSSPPIASPHTSAPPRLR
ncbi:MAG TPA: hemerythrin domain-containing protein [Kofleriaceae bacterium]|nr:hemerythrin domain-containing protein [Kofleriaceae bacterium]